MHHADRSAGAELARACVTLSSQRFQGGDRMAQKTETLNLRVSPELKELVRVAAAREHRTVANLIEVLVRDHCSRHGVAVKAVTKLPK